MVGVIRSCYARGALGGSGQRSFGEDADQVHAILGGAAHVGDRRGDVAWPVRRRGQRCLPWPACPPASCAASAANCGVGATAPRPMRACFDRFAVGGKLHPRAGADDGDVHLVARDEPLVGRAATWRLAAERRASRATRPAASTFLPGRGAELLDLDLALAFRPGNDARRAMGDQSGNRVGRGRRVAQVAADARPALNLPAADDPGRVGQCRIGRGDLGVLINAVAGHAGAQPQALRRPNSSAPSARESS